MEFDHITENTRTFIKELIPWGKLKGTSNSYVITLRHNKNIVAYAIIGHDKNGIVLDHEYHFKNIKDVIEWIQVKEEYQKNGHGSALVKYIRDLYYAKDVPICLYAKEHPVSTTSFYYKLGAIMLIDDNEQIIHDRFLAFMKLNQVDVDFKEGVQETIRFEKEHSNRKICDIIHENDDGEKYSCDWIWKNTDMECERCKNEGVNIKNKFNSVV